MDNILSKLRNTPKQQEDQSFLVSSSPDHQTSSQCQTPFTIMKLDFQRLKSIKHDEACISVCDIITTAKYKIKEVFYGLIKKIEKYSSDICYIEMVDESGSIGCSCMFNLVKNKCLTVGTIVKISNFSLWKIDANHINLVDTNVIEIY